MVMICIKLKNELFVWVIVEVYVLIFYVVGMYLMSVVSEFLVIVDELVVLFVYFKFVGIGEIGLDYYYIVDFVEI